MRVVSALIRDRAGTAAAEAIMIAPLLIVMMAGAMEIGNFFLTQHAVTKQVRDGARYASRLTLSESYSCPGDVFADADANTNIIKVTKSGAVNGTGNPRFGSAFWVACTGSPQPVSVSIRCVPKGDYRGIYATIDTSIPVVTVSADVAYPSLLGTLGFPTASLCLHADSEVPVAGL